MGEMGVGGSGVAGLETLLLGPLLTKALPPGLLVQLGWGGFGISLERATG